MWRKTFLSHCLIGAPSSRDSQMNKYSFCFFQRRPEHRRTDILSNNFSSTFVWSSKLLWEAFKRMTGYYFFSLSVLGQITEKCMRVRWRIWLASFHICTKPGEGWGRVLEGIGEGLRVAFTLQLALLLQNSYVKCLIQDDVSSLIADL